MHEDRLGLSQLPLRVGGIGAHQTGDRRSEGHMSLAPLRRLGEPRDDGRVRVRVAAPMALSIAEHLAGWGAAVEVLEPDSVKAELARLGAELVQRYAPR